MPSTTVLMASPEDVPEVGDSRALMTDRDRQQLAMAGEAERREHYQAVSRIRRRIEDELTVDVELLREHHPGLLEELREVVCDED